MEPFESGKAEFLPLAPTTAEGAPMVKLVLRLRLQNNETSTVTVTGITYSFPGSSQPAVVMQDINSYDNLGLAAGAVDFWCNAKSHKTTVDNAIYLSGSAPPKLKVELFCQNSTGTNFTEPATITLPLAAHQSPVAGDAYLFPYAASDLRAGEYMLTGDHWANGGTKGPQIFAHDFGCLAWDDNVKDWLALLPGGDRMKNEDYRVYNKPVRAMANGTVTNWSDHLEENTITVNEKGELVPPKLLPADGAGNNITIKYGTEIVRYFHLRKDTIAEELKQIGAPVYPGQMLGRVGNTGASPCPHTHIECASASDDALRPLMFRDAWVIAPSELSPPDAGGPWFELQCHGIPREAVLVWPGTVNQGKYAIWRFVGPLAWAWIIFVGGLMITPGGVSCPKCGGWTSLLAIVSIVLGVLGFVSRAITGTKQGVELPQINMQGNKRT